MNRLLLVLLGCIELTFTFCLGKTSRSVGLEKGLWCSGTVSAIVLGLLIITKVFRTLPIGTAYTVWTGTGAVGTALMDIIFFKGPASFGRLFSIFTLTASIIGLKVVSA